MLHKEKALTGDLGTLPWHTSSIQHHQWTPSEIPTTWLNQQDCLFMYQEAAIPSSCGKLSSKGTGILSYPGTTELWLRPEQVKLM